jgi:multiple sugar transport system ATP-binding protein
MRKFERAEIDRRVKHAAEVLGIQPLLERRPRQLSGGQRQRVALGRAIVRNPRVFLFDEPLSNLDAALRVQMRVELKRLHDRLDTTAIYVTHDQVEAMTLGDRVVVMKDGMVQQEGAPLVLYQRPANRFVAGFIGSPAMNFIPVTLEWSEHALWAHAPGLRVRVPPARTEALRQHVDQRVILGLRPESLHPATGGDGAEYAFEAMVEVVEPLGSEILLDTRVGDVPVVARVEPGVRVSAHERVRLAFDPARAHFFDAGSEAAI